MTRAFLPVLLLLPALLPADTAPLGALRSSTPVVTNETDTAFLSWRTNAPAILLGSGASNAAGGPDVPWRTRDIAIGDGAEACAAVAIGPGSTGSVYSASVGPNAYAGPVSASVGYSARAGDHSVAIGYRAEAPAYGAVQIGEGRNESRGTLQVMGWPLLDSRGVIPPARLGSMPLRASLFSGAAVDADPAVFLYWCTNCTASPWFDVSAALPDDSDAMRWDLWISAGAFGFSADRIRGVTWVGPNGPPDSAAVAPGETLMLGCTAVRAASGAVLILADYRATVAVTAQGGAVPAPPRVPGRIRVRSVSGASVNADGSADVYTLSLSSSSDFGVHASIPASADGIEFEIWVSNVSSGAITPSFANTLLGEMPSIPAGGCCVLRCRSVRNGRFLVETIATVEGSTPSGRSLSAGLVSPSPDAAAAGEGLAEGDER